MKFLHLYSGTDGQSHVEEMSLDSRPDLAELQAVQGVKFQVIEPGPQSFMDWHHAPKRQYVIMLAGEMEIGLGDGSVHRLGPGDVLFAEDLTGQGHTRRVISNTVRVSATVPLADQEVRPRA